MRILHLVHTPRYSGAEILVAALTKIHLEMGHSSRVASIYPPEEDFVSVLNDQEKDGIRWISPAKALTKLSRCLFIRGVAKEFAPDVIFAHSVIPAAYARLAGVSRVVTVLHDASEDDYKSMYFSLSEKFLQYRAAGVIAVSEIAKRNYLKRFDRPVVRCIPNGIDIKSLIQSPAMRSQIRHRLGFREEDFLVVQVGRIGKVKRQHLSLEAVRRLIEAGRSINILFAGVVEDASYLALLSQTAEEAGIARNVHFLGPRKDISEILCAADLYLMPSEREAHSIAMIEALAAGLPIVASTLPSFEYAKKFDGVTLLSVDIIENFSSSIELSMTQRRRFTRNLNGLDIRDTALAYIEFGSQCTS